MKSMQKGFTLIELMIVVAIIAILAAIAIPQYQTYVIRSQVTRVMGEAGDQKVVVEDCLNNGYVGVVPASGNTTVPSCVTTSSSSDLAGHPVVTTVNGAGSTVVATFTANGNANPAIQSKNLTWTRDSSGDWSCTTNVPAQYIPAGCTAQ